MASVTPYLDVQHLTKSFGAHVLFEDISFSVAEGQKVGLVARNGTGKSTLLSILTGVEGYDSGQIIFRRDIRVGYLEQTPKFNDADTVLDACFNHSGDEAKILKAKQILTQLKVGNMDQAMGTLSGGQQRRVALANVLITEPDMLVLDEPTNHLDMVTRQALTLALKDYQGSIIFVSHDRYFVDELATHILYIDHHKPYFMEGNYLDFKEKEASLFSLSDELEDEKKPVIKEKVVSDKPKSKRSPLKLEELINKTEAEIKKVEEDLFEEENYMDYHKSQALEKKLDALKADLAKLEEEYLS